MKSRSEALEVARGYLGTPYVLGGRLKNAGVDCATFLACYLTEIGLATPEEIAEQLGLYSHDWFQHARAERYLRALMRFGKLTSERLCNRNAGPQPGDIALFRCASGHLFNHGAVVTAWPFGVHAALPAVTECNLATHRLTAYKEMAVFDPFAKMEGTE